MYIKNLLKILDKSYNEHVFMSQNVLKNTLLTLNNQYWKKINI